jgi:hypothetical protein
MSSMLMISCWLKHVGMLLSVFNVWHFKLMFYYIEVHLLDHYTQWIKMHGETVKYSKQTLPMQSLLSKCHIVWWYMYIYNFIYTPKESMSFSELIFMKITMLNSKTCIYLNAEFHPDDKINVESIDRNLFTSVSKAWLSAHQLS